MVGLFGGRAGVDCFVSGWSSGEWFPDTRIQEPRLGFRDLVLCDCQAQLMSELYARIAQKCGKPLLDEVAGGCPSD